MATLRQRNKRSQKLAYMLLGEGRSEAGDLGLDLARHELQRSRDEVPAHPAGRPKRSLLILLR